MNRITRHLGCFAAAAPMLAAIMLSGCSTGGLFGSSSPDQAAASPSLTQRFSSFFSRSEKQTATVPGAEGEPAKEIDCPPVDVRHGTGVMAVNSGPAGASATTLRHQLTIARTARECVLVGENLKMKVGG